MAIYDIHGAVLSDTKPLADQTILPYPTIRSAADLTAHGCTLTTSDETVTLSGDANSYTALDIPAADVESQYVRFSAECAITSGGAKLQLAGRKKNSASNMVADLAAIKAGTVEQGIDLAWYDVYSDFDMTKSLELRITLTGAKSSIRMTRPALLKKAFDCSFVADTGAALGKVLENVQTAIRESIVVPDASYTAPDGSKYLLQVSAAGETVFVPVIPKKALFIGNSLLIGFGQFGMCASNAQSDYYYHVTQAILKQNASFTADRAAGTSLEGATSDETQDTAYSSISGKLSADLDLVIVQLSDNTNNAESIAYLLGGGAKRLLTKIRTACPKARVVWAAAWYSSTEKLNAIQKACADTGCLFVDFSDLRTSENQGAIGNTITYPDGSSSTIEASGVASHPGDKGMKAIADRLLEKLGIANDGAAAQQTGG